MLTQDQIAQFIALVEDEGYMPDADEVVATRDTMADFRRTFGAQDRISDGLHIWESAQAERGDRRRTLMVFDYGDVRAAFTI